MRSPCATSTAAGGRAGRAGAARRLLAAVLLLAWLPSTVGAASDAAPPAGRHALLVSLDGAIGPAISDYVVRALGRAEDEGAELVILRLDTPGGLDSAMRDIIRKMLAASVPIVVYVAPSGARAASAGTYILYASHLAAMAPATNLGAATPIRLSSPFPGGGDRAPEREPRAGKEETGKGDASKDAAGTDEAGTDEEGRRAPGTAADRKAVNDAVAYIRGLARMHGRNVEWAEQAVREAASLSAAEALEQNVIELIADDVDALVAALDGRRVVVLGEPRTLATAGLSLERVEPDWRSRLLAIVTDPNVAYILMLLGVYGLFFELANPGYVLPGVVGAVSLLLAFYAFQVLPVSYAGLALMGLGIAFMIGEAFAPSMGALGIGGVVAFVIGSLILMDTDAEAYMISLPLIGAVAATSAAFFIGVSVLALRNRHRPVVSGREEMIGSLGEAVEAFADRGRIRVHGEIWEAQTSRPVARGESVRVRSLEGLVLDVEPTDKET